MRALSPAMLAAIEVIGETVVATNKPLLSEEEAEPEELQAARASGRTTKAARAGRIRMRFS
jgi:hypothetical protein